MLIDLDLLLQRQTIAKKHLSFEKRRNNEVTFFFQVIGDQFTVASTTSVVAYFCYLLSNKCTHMYLISERI